RISGAASTSQRLPEGLGDGPTMQRLGVAACEHLDHRAEVTPRLLGLAPVILDPRWRLVDLIEDVASVASALGARVERVLQLGTLGEVVTQQRVRTLAIMGLGHERAMTLDQSIHLGHLVGTGHPRDEELRLA